MPTDYDISAAFARIEEELIASMMRNLSRHRAEEEAEGFNWSAWQAEQLKALEVYRRNNRKTMGRRFASVNAQMRELIQTAYEDGGADEEADILQAIVSGAKLTKPDSGLSAGFMRVNENKLGALLTAVTGDMEKAEYAVLRRSNDAYRRIIFDAQVYANAGAATYGKAVDMATKDFLAAGIQCVEYKNGARHTLSDYADMAIRTAVKRAYLHGEGGKRQEWGISTVILNKRTNACPHCAKFCGRVFIDDVWSGGKPSDGDYPLLSSAIAQGLYHPRCKDSHTTFFPDITEEPKPWKREELDEMEEREQHEARQSYAQRQAEKFERLEQFSLDHENKQEYGAKAEAWKQAANQNAKLKAKELGVNASYSGFNPEFAECINDCIEKAQERFGSLKSLRNVRGVTIPKPKEYAGYGKGTKTLFLHNPSNPDILDQMKEDAEFQFSMGGWSTSDYRHAIMHEIGHAIQAQHLTVAKRDKLETIRREALARVTGSDDTDLKLEIARKNPALEDWGKQAKAELSLYGLASVGELISESVAQITLGEPSSIAQKVIRILME